MMEVNFADSKVDNNALRLSSCLAPNLSLETFSPKSAKNFQSKLVDHLPNPSSRSDV